MLSDAVKQAILAEVPKYPEPRSALLMALHFIQAELGHVPISVQREVAALLGLRPIEVREVVTFYPMYHEHPVGKRNIQVCVNIACALAVVGERDSRYEEEHQQKSPGPHGRSGSSARMVTPLGAATTRSGSPSPVMSPSPTDVPPASRIK